MGGIAQLSVIDECFSYSCVYVGAGGAESVGGSKVSHTGW